MRHQQHLHIHWRQHSLVHVPVRLLELDWRQLYCLFHLRRWLVRDNRAHSDERSHLHNVPGWLFVQWANTASGVWVSFVILQRRRILVHTSFNWLLYNPDFDISHYANRAGNMPDWIFVQLG